MALGLEFSLLLLVQVVGLLDVLRDWATLPVQLSVLEQRAWHGLWVEGLVVARGLWVLDSWLVALVLLLLLLVPWLLETLALVLLRAVLVYPALGRIASLRAYPVKWGPIVRLLQLFLTRLRRKLLRLRQVLLVLDVLGRYLGRIVFLQEGVEVVFVLLVRGGQMRSRPLVLVPLLHTALFLRLILLRAGVALPD